MGPNLWDHINVCSSELARFVLNLFHGDDARREEEGSTYYCMNSYVLLTSTLSINVIDMFNGNIQAFFHERARQLGLQGSCFI